jgi:hypothetical protein
VQHAADVLEALVQLRVQQGFGRGLLGGGHRLAIEVDDHDVGFRQLALVAAGDGDRHVLCVHPP